MSNKKISYTINIDAEISNLESKLAAAKNSISKLTENGANPQMVRSFELIEKSIDKLKTKAAQPITTASMFSGFTKETANITLQLDKLLQSITDIIRSTDGEVLDLLPPDTLNQINSVISALNTFNNTIEKATTETEELTAARKELAKAEADLNKWQTKKTVAAGAIEGTKKQIEETNALKKAAEERIATLEKEKAEATKRIQEINAIYDKLEAEGKPVDRRKKVTLSDGTETSLAMEGKKIKKADTGVEEASVEIQGYEAQLANLSNALKKFNTDLTTAEGKINGYGNVISQCKTKVIELENAFRTGSIEQQKKAFDELRASAHSLGVDLSGISTEGTAEDVRLLTERMTQLADNGISQAQGAAHNIAYQFEDLKGTTKGLNSEIEGAANGFNHMQESANQLSAIENRIKQFVSATGVIRFFTSALKNAFSAVKELDSVMTEMAMVTDLNVGDYWDQMPEYTKRANELGVSIKGAYESATLFYQQGLNTNEVVALSNQTLKMAKIAGLDAAEATDRMTAALRGFNMELNEASAQKVADVYSQLAAITASDVDEISTAMTKTASIASNAGMEFETTAAFLAQIIETTRESAETAGTAMKTVIARFQELKKDPAEIGEVDGEIVDANKIETALRSVGVSLRDAQGQFRNLDDVFMELASKWDSLDTNTQRYIATIAAGSRQQSRFIAMMSDYGRTQELVGEAQNSAGASNKQYEKSLDSLDSKLNQLKNAWTEFTTGIMNSDLVKFFVDLLTNFVNGINQVTQGFSFLGQEVQSVTKTISKVGMVMAIFNLLSALVKKLGKEFGLSLAEGAKTGGLSLRKEVESAVEDAKGKTKELNPSFANPPRQAGQEFSEASQQRLQRLIEERDKSQKIIDQILKEHGRLTRGKTKVQVDSGDGTVTTTLDDERKKVEERQAEIDSITGKPAPAPKKPGVIKTMFGNVSSGYAEANEGAVWLQRNQNAQSMLREELSTDRTAQYDADITKMTNAIGDPASISSNPSEQMNLSTLIENAGVGDSTAALLPLEQIKTQFEEKMTAMLGSTEEASTRIQAAWDEMSDKIENEGMTMSQAVDLVDTKLDETATETATAQGGDVNDNKQKLKNDGHTNIKVDTNMANKVTSTKGADVQMKKQTKAQKELIKLEQDYSKNAQKHAKKVTDGYKKMTSSISNVGSTLSVVGAGMGTLGSALESAGVKGAADTFGKLGNVISTVGGVVSVFGTIMGALTPVISAVTGATAAKTTAETADTAATVANTGATIADTGAEIANTGAEVVNTGATLTHTGAEGADTAATTANTVAAGANTAAKYAQAGGEVAATTAAFPLAAIMLIIVSIIAVLVILIVALVAAFQKMKAESPEGQLQAAAEASEKAAEKAEEAAEAYNNLRESLNGLKDSYKNLEGLTRGTEEWNNAVEEINGSVLDLVEQYPELAGLMTNEGGVLTLDVESDEVQDVLQKYETDAVAAKAASLQAKATVKEKEGAVEYKKLSKDAQLGSQTGLTWAKVGAGALAAGAAGPIGQVFAAPIFQAIKEREEDNKENTDAMARALAEGAITIGENGEAIIDEQRIQEYGLTTEAAKAFAEELGGGAEELKKYGESLNAAEVAQAAYYKSMSASAQQLVDASKYTADEMTSMSVMFDAKNMESRVKAEEAAVRGMSDDEYLAAAKELYGDDVEVDKDGNITYKDESGEDVEVSRDAAIEQMAAARATEKAAAAMEELPGAIKSMARELASITGQSNTELSDSLTRLFAADNGEKLTQTNIDTLDSITDEDINAAYDKLTKEEKEAYGSAWEFRRVMWDKIYAAEQGLLVAQQKATLEGFEIFNNMVSKVANDYAIKMQNLGAQLGEGTTGLEAMSNSIEVLKNSLTTDDFNKAMGIINSIDWTNASEWESLPETFRQMGLNIPSGALNDFIDVAIKTSGAVKKIDLEKLNEKLLSTQQVIQGLLNGEQEFGNFSEEFVEDLKSLDSTFGDKFLMKLDGTYTYIGGTMEDLIDAINENTVAQLNKSVDQLNTKLSMIDIMKQMDEVGSITGGEASSMIINKDKWVQEDKRGYLTTFAQQATAKGLDLGSLGIANLDNETDFSKLDDASIDNIINQMYGMYQDGADVINSQISKIYRDSFTKTFQNSTFLQNIQGASALQGRAEQGGITGLSTQTQIKDEWYARTAVTSSQARDAGVDSDIIDTYNETVAQLNEIDWFDSDGNLTTEAKALFAVLNQCETSMQTSYNTITEAKKRTEEWRTEFDLIDKINEKIAATQRERNNLEREYNQALKDGKLTAEEVLQYSAEKITLLRQEADAQAKIAAAAQNEISKKLSNNELSGFNKFITRDANGAIVVDTAGANEAFKDNEELGSQFEDYVSELRDLEGTAREAEEALYDIEDTVEEIEESGKEDYNSLLNELKEALVSEQEKAIEAMSEVNDAIDEVNSDIQDKIQKQIDEQRQARQNAETEKNLLDSKAQLDALRRDTSGANAAQIAQQEQALKKNTQQYQDSLIDQALNKLAQDSEEAAQQRERQISLLEQQLEIYSSSSAVWQDAKELLETSLSSEGDISTNLLAVFDRLGYLEGMSPMEQDQFAQQLGQWGAGALNWAALTAEDQATRQAIQSSSNAEITATQNAANSLYDNLTSALGTKEGSTINKSIDTVKTETGKIEDWLEDEADGIEKIMDQNEDAIKTALGTDIETANQGVQDEASGIKSFLTTAKQQEDKEKAQKNAIEKAQNRTNLLNSAVELTEEQFKEYGTNSGFKNYQDYITQHTSAHKSRLTKESMSGKKLGKEAWEKTYKGKTDHANYESYSSAYDKYYTKPEEINQTENKSKVETPETKNKFTALEAFRGYPIPMERKGFDSKENKWFDLGLYGESDSLNWDKKVETGNKIGDEEARRLNKIVSTVNNGHKHVVYADLYGQGYRLYIKGNGPTEWYEVLNQGADKNSDDYPKGLTEHARKYVARTDIDEKYTKFKTGGLADFTGPAWLDGTPSKPEYILNADQTQAFFRLIDVLTGLDNTSNNISNGDNYFDIDINVESISDDYDVEQIAEKIKEMIYDDSMYRNVHNINPIR